MKGAAMIEKKITQSQLIAIGCCYVMGTIIVSVFISSVLGRESWIAGPAGFVAFLPALLTFCALTKKYPGKSLFEINEEVFGPAAGRIMSGIYLVFFLSIMALNVLESTNFLSFYVMPKTPSLAIAVVIVTACVYSVKKGILPLARVSTIFGIVSFVIVLFNLAMSLGNVSFGYLLPIFDHKPLDYVQGAHIAAAIPYGESVILLMLTPKVNEKANLKTSYIAIAVFTALIIMLLHIRETISLGALASFPSLPSYEVVRMINIADTLTRTESLFALVLLSLTFFKMLILLYICLSGISQIFRLGSYRHIAVMTGAFLTIYALDAYGAPGNNIYWGKNVSPFIWTFFSLILPVFTLAFSAVKGPFLRIRGRARRGEPRL